MFDALVGPAVGRQCSSDSGTTWTATCTRGTSSVNGTTYSETLTGVTDSTAYTVRARAKNSLGTGTWRQSAAVPGAPTGWLHPLRRAECRSLGPRRAPPAARRSPRPRCGPAPRPQATTKPTGKALNVNVSYAGSKFWIRFNFNGDDGGLALAYLSSAQVATPNTDVNAGIDIEVGTEADKTHNATTYDVVLSFDHWRIASLGREQSTDIATL